jgi:DNA-binding NtrC family response regulator
VTARRRVILLVDGDIIIRHQLSEYLRECGFTVIEASSGEDAMRVLVMPELRIELVLTDLATTGGGFVLRQWIMAANPGVTIMLAGSVDQALSKAGDICNDGPALVKPYEHHLVLERIKQAISARDRQKV